MCGIAGVFCAGRLRAEESLRAMNRRQSHRGPDDQGRETVDVPGGTLVLGHHRLSILDLSTAGHQPMRNPDTGDWIVYNGEIYNYPQLRRELESAGVSLQTRCDTEVILRGFARWGVRCFDRLHGMFAVALYDKRRQRLILARDHLGIKPLYYAICPHGLAFASEVRALQAGGLTSREIDRRAVAGLLAYGSVPGPLTMYKGVRLLEPGTWGGFDLSRPPGSESALRTERYWDFPPPRRVADRNQAVAEVRSCLQAAARSHLLSDVPVGVFLSSGLDSTAVATLCAAAEPETINTFTVSLADHPEIDESPVARHTARLLGTGHQHVSLSDAEVRRCAQNWLGSLDQPSVDGLNTYIISGAVRRRGMKVALSGLGGDEVFGGYAGFRDIPRLTRWARAAQCIPRSIRAKIAEFSCAGRSKSRRRKAKELAGTRCELRNIYFRRRRLFSDIEMRTFGFDAAQLDLNEDYLPAEVDPDHALAGLDPEAAVSVLETRFYMGNMLLRDSDVFGMAHALEIRVPFLDRDVVDYVFSLPGKWRVARGGVNKPLLVDAMGGQLRPELVNLRKRGFSLPYADWMAGPLREQFQHLLQTTGESGAVAPGSVATVWQDFLQDIQGPTWSRAWMLGVLGAWIEQSNSGKMPLPKESVLCETKAA